MPDHVRAVIGAGPGEQSLDQHRLGDVQVDGGVEGQIQPGADLGGRDGLRQGPGKPVEYVPAARGRGGHDREEQVEHDLVGHQIAALLTRVRLRHPYVRLTFSN